jgi:hypothetical protein
MEPTSEKLQRIYELLAELKKTKVNTPEHEALLKKIRALSAEYKALINIPPKAKAAK